MPDELLLIDGNSLAYRAFFALPESIATSTGMPTNAIFGFASMLVKILTDYGPKATVVVWDAGYTGRKELYPEYKAQRSSRPDLLKEQWPHFEPLVEAFGYRNLRVEGFEADDVIASITALAHQDGESIPVMVLTGDRDAFQLVDEHTRIMATWRGITDTKVYDTQGVIDRYGIPPELVPDFIGLKGDTSDNIPGVPGIGDKTAAELLQRFGSLENVLGIDRRDLGRQAQGEPDRPRGRRPPLQAARHRQARHPAGARPGGSSPRSRTARSCATPSGCSSCATRCAGSRRRSAPPTPRRPPPASPSRAGGAVAARAPRRSDARRAVAAAEHRGRGRAAPARHSGGRAVRRRPASGASGSTSKGGSEVLPVPATGRPSSSRRSARGR